MPSKSPAQARFMAAAAHNPKFAKKVGIPQKVAKEFNAKDTGTKMLSDAMKAATAAADAAKASALAAKAAVDKVSADTTAFLGSFETQLNTLAMIIKKIAVKLKA